MQGLASYGLPERIGAQARAVAARGRLRPTVSSVHATVACELRVVCAWQIDRTYGARAWCEVYETYRAHIMCVARGMRMAQSAQSTCVECVSGAQYMHGTYGAHALHVRGAW